MTKTILLTGATDGIGLETAKTLVEQGHRVLLHGRNPDKLEKIASELSSKGTVEKYVADLSDFQAVAALAKSVSKAHSNIDVLINNAGVFRVPTALLANGFDVRFMVNTIAPYLLVKGLLPQLGHKSRVVNLASAAQASVNLNALAGKTGELEAKNAYAQSKLAIIMWSFALAAQLGQNGPMIVAVNPGSLLASKMVKEGFGIEGKDIRIGADILVRAALSEEFNDASGRYFDNDSGRFADPNADALDMTKCRQVLEQIEKVLEMDGYVG